MRRLVVLILAAALAGDVPKRVVLTGLGWEALDELGQGSYVMGWQDGFVAGGVLFGSEFQKGVVNCNKSPADIVKGISQYLREHPEEKQRSLRLTVISVMRQVCSVADER